MLQSDLRAVLLPTELEALLQTIEVIETLGSEKRQLVRETFARSYNVQFKIMLGFAAAQVLAAGFLWKRGKQLRTA